MTYKGKVYMSKLEAQYRKYLDTLPDLVQVDEQVSFVITINDIKICTYKLDFKVTYLDRVEYIDVKGMTYGSAYQMFKLKKKLVEACFRTVKITEITNKDFKPPKL